MSVHINEVGTIDAVIEDIPSITVSVIEDLSSINVILGAVYPTIDGDIFEIESKINETLRVGATGATGATGEQGIAGFNVYSGETIPENSFGVNSETYIHVTTGDIYIKEDGIWTITSNIIGPTGPSGKSGGLSYELSAITYDENWTELFIDGTSPNRLVISPNSTWFFTIKITGRRIDGGANESASYKIEGSIERNNNTISLVGITLKTVLNEQDENWDVLVEADSINNSLSIKTKGIENSTVKWIAAVENIEVSE